MKSNLILLLTIILFLGIISSTMSKKQHKKRMSFKTSRDDKNKAAAQPAQSTQSAAQPAAQAVSAKPAEQPTAVQPVSAKKSLQSLNSIIQVLQQKQPQQQSNNVNDVKLFLEQQINPESLKSPQDLQNEKKCELKQGYLTQILKSDVVNNKTILQGRHVFTVLNKQTISIFEAVHVNSLIASLELDELAAPVITKEKLNCFDLQTKSKKERGFELCASNSNQMKQWMSDIKNMLTCQVSDPVQIQKADVIEESVEDTSDELKLKITKKRAAIENELTKDEQEEQIAQAKSAEFQRQQQIKDEQQKKIIQEQMEKAIEEMKKKRQIEEKRKRIEEYKRKRIEAQNSKTKEDLKCLEKKLEGEEYNQRKQVEIQIKDEVAKEIQTDLSATISNIAKAEQKGTEELMNDEKELTEEKRDQQTKFQDILVQEVMEYEKEINPAQCWKDNSKGSNIKKVCHSFIQPGQAVDIEQLKTCLDQTKFCNICCNYNIGKSKQLEIKTCSDKCERVVNPEKYLKEKAQTGILTDQEKAELYELDGNGLLVTVKKGDRIPGWNKQQN